MAKPTDKSVSICVALGVSPEYFLIYILSDGSEVVSNISVKGEPGTRYPITPREFGNVESTQKSTIH